MKTGFRGTFVISWSQTELDGLGAAPFSGLRAGATWRWTGEAVRVDGPTGVLPLGEAEGQADMRRRAAHAVRRLLRAVDADTTALDSVEVDAPLFEAGFIVTDGHDTWQITLIETGQGRKPLCMFMGEIPPRGADLWIVSHNVELHRRDQAGDPAGAVICFTPGTLILTEDGPRRVETIGEGDLIQTKDDGVQEVLWVGRRRITGARLQAMPQIAPVRLAAGALGTDVPDDGLLVSPDHRILLRGAQVNALFNTDEALVCARDLVNDTSVFVDRAVRELAYIHILLPDHQVVFANGVETESFHPASAGRESLLPDDLARLTDILPEIEHDPHVYGGYARRMVSSSEAQILRHEVA